MRWHIGDPEYAAPGSNVVGLRHQDLVAARAQGRTAVGMHELQSVPRGTAVDVVVPAYRPKKFLDVLGWLTCAVVDPGAQVSWLVESSKGPKSIRKLLEQAGWQLDLVRSGKITRLTGVLDRTYEIPQPSAFHADLGPKAAELFADYGVFSPGRVDDGTALLLDIALAEKPVETVADIGIGYGPLAIGLVLNGIADRAVATDVDSVALWLAEQNARHHSIPLELTLTDNPIDAEPTALTVCNIPTHISSDGTRLLIDALGTRAASGRLLAVVHSTLTDRYTRYFTALGRTVAATPGPQHTVLTVTAGRTCSPHG